MGFEAYFDEIRRALDRLAVQAPAIRRAGALVAEALRLGRLLHVFGAGHSHLLAEEAFYRAGGLAAVNPLLERRLTFFDGALASSRAEAEPGLAGRILADADVGAGDAAIVASNSGRNVVPVEMALGLQERGACVIAITCLAHSQAVIPRHPSGRRLFEVADVVIDNAAPLGDACVDLAPGVRMAPLSTVTGAAIVHAVALEAAAELMAGGITPPVLPSANVDGTAPDLERILAPYADRIRYLDLEPERPG